MKRYFRRVKFGSPTQKISLKSTCPMPAECKNAQCKVYSTGPASGKFCVTWAGVGVWRWIENEADAIQDGGPQMTDFCVSDDA